MFIQYTFTVCIFHTCINSKEQFPFWVSFSSTSKPTLWVCTLNEIINDIWLSITQIDSKEIPFHHQSILFFVLDPVFWAGREKINLSKRIFLSSFDLASFNMGFEVFQILHLFGIFQNSKFSTFFAGSIFFQANLFFIYKKTCINLCYSLYYYYTILTPLPP